MLAKELHNKLTTIRTVLPVHKIISRNAEDTAQISKYYQKNRIAYQLFNSHKGFVHMGISESNNFSKTDFYAQAKLINKLILDTNAQDVLELAAGKGATIKYLAKQHPSVQFNGLDLPHGQMNAKSKINNLALQYGDYHSLKSYKNISFDIVYIIEALCHAHDKDSVIKEVNRVLRPGGLFVIIDGYFADTSKNLTNDEKVAIELVMKSMMVTTNNQAYSTTLTFLKNNGFKIQDSIDYSKNIMPSLRRLELTASRFFKHRHLANIINRTAGDIVTANAAAGYLMPTCIELGIFEYRYTLAKKV